MKQSATVGVETEHFRPSWDSLGAEDIKEIRHIDMADLTHHLLSAEIS